MLKLIMPKQSIIDRQRRLEMFRHKIWLRGIISRYGKQVDSGLTIHDHASPI